MASAPKVSSYITRPIRYSDREPGNYTITDDERLRVDAVISGGVLNVVIGAGLTQPVVDARTSINLGFGSSILIDATAVALGQVGKLLAVSLASSGAMKWEILVDTIVRDVVMTIAGDSKQWITPHVDLVTLVGDGAKAFHVQATSLEQREAADVYVTFFWDET